MKIYNTPGGDFTVDMISRLDVVGLVSMPSLFGITGFMVHTGLANV